MHKLEEVLEYKFNDVSLIDEALTHPSLTRLTKKDEKKYNYERLEFLGDAVLGLVIAELLMIKYPDEKEGELAKRQAGLVRGEAVTNVAVSLNLGKFIKMTVGEEATGGRENASNVENVLEAIIGAIYSDSNLCEAKKFIEKHWAKLIEKMIEPPKDAKTSLQEWAQARGLAIPSYNIISTDGPSHSPHFTVQVDVQNMDNIEASGTSKKKAEKAAARKMLVVIKETDN